MASCIKCGQAKLKRDKAGVRKCKKCGAMPSAKFLNRGGNYPAEDSCLTNVSEIKK